MTLANMRILIVENSLLMGEVIAESIAEAGGQPLGPVINAEEALDMINYNPGKPDAAVLDLGLAGASLDVARRLDDLGVPFIFATGQPGDVPSELRHHRLCLKPYTPADLMLALSEATRHLVLN